MKVLGFELEAVTFHKRGQIPSKDFLMNGRLGVAVLSTLGIPSD